MRRVLLVAVLAGLCFSVFAEDLKVSGVGIPLSYAPAVKIPEEARAKHLKGLGVFIAHLYRDGSVRHVGFTESIVARLRDVGGNARLFSSPGSGTTVVLEVPK